MIIQTFRPGTEKLVFVPYQISTIFRYVTRDIFIILKPGEKNREKSRQK